MEKKGRKFLPIGSVVMLKNGNKRIMITGFCSMDLENSEKIWDYNGCLYPEGIIASNQSLLFDHSQIKDVYFKGLADDEEEKKFKKNLNALLKEYEKVAKDNQITETSKKTD